MVSRTHGAVNVNSAAARLPQVPLAEGKARGTLGTLDGLSDATPVFLVDPARMDTLYPPWLVKILGTDEKARRVYAVGLFKHSWMPREISDLLASTIKGTTPSYMALDGGGRGVNARRCIRDAIKEPVAGAVESSPRAVPVLLQHEDTARAFRDAVTTGTAGFPTEGARVRAVLDRVVPGVPALRDLVDILPVDIPVEMPAILICPERVGGGADDMLAVHDIGVERCFEIMYKIVWAHELAHRFMDNPCKDIGPGSFIKVDGVFVEESLANAVALHVLQAGIERDILVSFSRVQPPPYAGMAFWQELHGFDGIVMDCAAAWGKGTHAAPAVDVVVQRFLGPTERATLRCTGLSALPNAMKLHKIGTPASFWGEVSRLVRASAQGAIAGTAGTPTVAVPPAGPPAGPPSPLSSPPPSSLPSPPASRSRAVAKILPDRVDALSAPGSASVVEDPVRSVEWGMLPLEPLDARSLRSVIVETLVTTGSLDASQSWNLARVLQAGLFVHDEQAFGVLIEGQCVGLLWSSGNRAALETMVQVVREPGLRQQAASQLRDARGKARSKADAAFLEGIISALERDAEPA